MEEKMNLVTKYTKDASQRDGNLQKMKRKESNTSNSFVKNRRIMSIFGAYQKSPVKMIIYSNFYLIRWIKIQGRGVNNFVRLCKKA